MKIKGIMAVVVVMLVVVVLAWVGITVIDSVTNVEVNANADSLRQPIQPDFDTSRLTVVNGKVAELEVAPEIFHKLEDEGIEGLKNEAKERDSEDEEEGSDEIVETDETPEEGEDS